MSRRKYKVIWIFGIVLFVAPLFIHVRATFRHYSPIYFALPHIYAGDEPYYLLMTSSIIKDFDLDVENNYQNAMQYGMNDAGERAKYASFDHHSVFFNPKSSEVLPWISVFNSVWGETNFFPPEVPYPRHPEKENIDLTNFREYIWHPIGLPLYLSFFLWPFRYFEYSNLYDSFAVFAMVIVALAGLFFFYKLLREFCPKNAELFTLVFAFGTPFWWYSRSVYPDLLLCTLLIGSLYFFILKKNYWITGIFMGFSILIKPYFALVGAMFFLRIVKEKKRCGLLQYSIPFIIFVVFQLIHNYLLYHNIFTFSQGNVWVPYKNWKEPFIRLFAIFLGPTHGIITFSPFLLFGWIFTPIYAKRNQYGWFISTILWIWVIFFISPGICGFYNPGFCYGPRYFLPVIPLLVLITQNWFVGLKNRGMKVTFFVFLFVSFIINLQSVFMFEYACYAPPWFMIELLAKKFLLRKI